MASLSPFTPFYPNQRPGVSQRTLAASPGLPPARPAEPNRLSAYSEAGQVQQTPQDQMIIGMALFLLGRIQNLPGDEAYVRRLGVEPVYHNGQEALQVIRSKNIRVEFGDMGDSPAHAQWVSDQNLIMINQKYRGDMSKATLYAISEAIYHEAGHASKVVRDPVSGKQVNVSLLSNNPADIGDDQSSIQEESNCLALNTLAHRYHEATDPDYARSSSSSRLISDGVALYSKLFFDPDPAKTGLVNRIYTKYGDLPPSSPGHEIPTNTPVTPIALRVLQRVSQATRPASCAAQANQAAPFYPKPAFLPNGPAGMPPIPAFTAWA
ncbi:MAG: hypothetical protein K0Q50_1593 [Vampirovibrio sp.]|nr:hypothetical protein [Vampirovibrio sp.]